MKIGVYGLGRFGKFWAGHCGKIPDISLPVLGYSRRTIEDLPANVEQASLAQLFSCDVIILCVAISAVEPVVREMAGKLREGCVVMDTCSVKVHPVQVMHRYLDGKAIVIGTHPMFGPDSGKNGIEGLPIVFCPEDAPGETRLFFMEGFERLGLRVLQMTPDEHDAEAAYTQGITHFIGRVLKVLDLKESSIATLGYQKLREIVEQTCNDPYQLFIDLQKYNPHTVEMRRVLHESIALVMKELDNLA